MEKRIETLEDLEWKVAQLRASMPSPTSCIRSSIRGTILLPLDPRAAIGDRDPADRTILVRFNKVRNPQGGYWIWDAGEIEHLPSHLKHLIPPPVGQ